VFYYIAVAFNVWMIVDAIRRRAELYWFIVLILPFGSLIYFFAVKARDYNFARLGGSASPKKLRVSALSELERRAEETPSVANKLALADALEAHERYAEASELYRDVLQRHPEDKQALHGLSRALLGLRKAEEAVEQLAKLMELESNYRDYSAALDYAEALWQTGRSDDAVDLLRGLVNETRRINHRLALAHYLRLAGHDGPARIELEEALRDFESSPEFVRRRDKKWADRAQRELRALA
jgi:hypothetical protein